MANLKEVRIRIGSVNSTQQITKAMKMVSASKLRKATDAIVQMRPYADKLRDILSNLTSSLESSTSVFAQEREVNNVLLVVITSNRGLCGGFNSSVIKMTNKVIAERYQAQKNAGKLHLICVGKKAQEYYTKLKFNVIGNNNNLFNELNFANSTLIADQILSGYSEAKWDKVELIYNQFKNAAVQILMTEQLLPLPKATEEKSSKKSMNNDYILEPTQEYIVNELIPKSLKVTLYKALLDSHASEHGARMTAMDKATENAGELLKALKLSYNQARQAAITNEILEIVSGANALSAN